MSGPTRRQIAEQNAFMVERQRVFRVVADRMAIALAEVDFVEKVALIGSVAGALRREVPRFQPFRRLGIEIAHECKDLDLAVWVSRVEHLEALKRVRARVSHGIFPELNVGVPSIRSNSSSSRQETRAGIWAAHAIISPAPEVIATAWPRDAAPSHSSSRWTGLRSGRRPWSRRSV